MSLTPQDDFFHTPTNDERWWSETYWFSFDDPERGLSGTFYPLLRSNLDIAALTVAIWAPEQSTAWTAPYYRGHWHLKPPEFSGNRMQIERLAYEVLEPLQAYRVTYDDSGVFSADLTIRGITENHVITASPDSGHWDQPTSVQGWLEFHGRRVDLDCFGMRDRSWGPRLDDASARASYTYAINGEASFLIVTRIGLDSEMSMGYLEQDGKRGRISGAEISVERDEQNRIANIRITAEDELGRTLETRGIPRNHLAKQASPGYFAWMSMIEWDFGGKSFGQFQDVWSPDRLSELNCRKLAL